MTSRAWRNTLTITCMTVGPTFKQWFRNVLSWLLPVFCSCLSIPDTHGLQVKRQQVVFFSLITHLWIFSKSLDIWKRYTKRHLLILFQCLSRMCFNFFCQRRLWGCQVLKHYWHNIKRPFSHRLCVFCANDCTESNLLFLDRGRFFRLSNCRTHILQYEVKLLLSVSSLYGGCPPKLWSVLSKLCKFVFSASVKRIKWMHRFCCILDTFLCFY